MTKYHGPLSIDELRDQQIPAPWNYGIRYRTTFGEIDMQGHISNVTYLRWFETLRMSYLRDFGWPEYATPNATPMVLRRVEVDFLKEINLSEDIIVTGRTVSVGNSSCVMNYAVWADGLRSTGSAVLVFLDASGAKSDLPGHLRKFITEKDLEATSTAE